MEIVAFSKRIDNAIRRKLQPKLDPETNQFVDLTSYQKENIISLYMEFVQTYTNEILDYLDELTEDTEFVDWCESNWSNMALLIAFYHTHANVLGAILMGAVKGYMRAFHAKCAFIGAHDLYKKRLKETDRFLEAHDKHCNVQWKNVISICVSMRTDF